MSCTYPTRGARPAPIWHRALCAECRQAKRVDALMSFAIDCRKAERVSPQSLGQTLASLDLPYSIPRPRRQRVVRALRASRRPAAYLFVGSAVLVFGWMKFIDIDPDYRTPIPAISGPNAYDDLRRAVSLIKDEKTLDLLLAKPAAQPPNGQGGLSQGMPAMSGGDMGLGSPVTDPSKSERLKPYSLDDKEAYVVQNQAVLDEASKGFGRQFLAPPIRTQSDKYIEISKFRWIARLFRLQAVNAAARGNWKLVVDSSLDAIELGELIRQNGGLSAAQVGNMCQASGRMTLWDTIGSLPAAEAQRAMDRLWRITARRQPFWEVLTEEKWQDLSLVQDATRISGWRAKWAGRFDDPNWTAWLYSLRYSKREMLHDLETYFNQHIALAKQPYVSHTFEQENELQRVNMILEWYVPTCTEDRVRDVANDAENQLLFASLAIRIFYLEHGRYPRWLNELPERIRPQLADPFGAGNFGYHLTEKSYTLYSIGPDGQDNAGTPIRSSSPGDVPASGVGSQSFGDIVAGVNR